MFGVPQSTEAILNFHYIHVATHCVCQNQTCEVQVFVFTHAKNIGTEKYCASAYPYISPIISKVPCGIMYLHTKADLTGKRFIHPLQNTYPLTLPPDQHLKQHYYISSEGI